MNELRTFIAMGNKEALPLVYRNLTSKGVDCLQNAELKGILFEVYSNLGDTTAYKKLNKISIKYSTKLWVGLSKEGYIIRDRLFTKIL